MIDALLAPFYKWIILVLLFFITGYVWYCNSLAGDLHNAETVCDVRVAKAIKPYEDAIDQYSLVIPLSLEWQGMQL